MQKILSFVCVFCFALTFVGCSPASEKGKWTEDDKKAVKTGFIDVAKKTLAANGQTVEDAVLEKIADCFTNKVEAEFASTIKDLRRGRKYQIVAHKKQWAELPLKSLCLSKLQTLQKQSNNAKSVVRRFFKQQTLRKFAAFFFISKFSRHSFNNFFWR